MFGVLCENCKNSKWCIDKCVVNGCTSGFPTGHPRYVAKRLNIHAKKLGINANEYLEDIKRALEELKECES